MRAARGAALLVLATAAAGLRAEAAEGPAPVVVDPASEEARPWFRADWYGVYAGEWKVGWMRRSLERTKRGEADVVAREIRVVLDVAGDGNDVENAARTVYAVAAPQALLEARSVQIDQGRRVVREVLRRDGRMDVVTERRGDRVAGSVAPLTVTLADEVAAERLAGIASSRDGGPAGATLTTTGIDLATLTEGRRVLTVTAARKSEGGSSELDVSASVPGRPAETFTTDAAGVLLRGSLGARFTFRRELETVAADPAFRTALAAASRVKLDEPLGDVAALRKIAVAWERGGAMAFPASARQKISRDGAKVVVTVDREADSGPAGDDACAAALRDEDCYGLSDPMLREGSTRILAGTTSRAAQVAKLLEFVRDHVKDEELLGTPPAGEVLRHPRGDSTEHARLFTALCRAAGIPAREVHGLAWLGDEAGAFGRRTWAEVAMDGRWRAVDPTAGRIPADAGHLAVDPSPASGAALLGVRFTLVTKE